MGYWLKRFSDKTVEKGTDLNVKIKITSWSKGRLHDMVAAEIEHANKTIRIIGAGDYWQSDTYESVFPNLKSTLLKRRIQKKIDKLDKKFCVNIKPNGIDVGFNNTAIIGKSFSITKSMVGKWLTVEMDLRTMHCKHYIAEGKR